MPPGYGNTRLSATGLRNILRWTLRVLKFNRRCNHCILFDGQEAFEADPFHNRANIGESSSG